MYEAMRDKFAHNMSYDAAQGKAARIYNSRHPGNPITGKHGKKHARKSHTPRILSYGKTK